MPFDIEAEDRRTAIKQKLRKYFDGKIVRKDLTKKIKEGANVPVYVLEFLLGQYCSSDDPEIIEQGVESVKKILADNFVRPDEAQKILSLLRQKGSHTVIDKITVSLNIKRDRYEAEFSNLGLSGVPIDEEYRQNSIDFCVAASGVLSVWNMTVIQTMIVGLYQPMEIICVPKRKIRMIRQSKLSI